MWRGVVVVVWFVRISTANPNGSHGIPFCSGLLLAGGIASNTSGDRITLHHAGDWNDERDRDRDRRRRAKNNERARVRQDDRQKCNEQSQQRNIDSLAVALQEQWDAAEEINGGASHATAIEESKNAVEEAKEEIETCEQNLSKLQAEKEKAQARMDEKQAALEQIQQELGSLQMEAGTNLVAQFYSRRFAARAARTERL